MKFAKKPIFYIEPPRERVSTRTAVIILGLSTAAGYFGLAYGATSEPLSGIARSLLALIPW